MRRGNRGRWWGYQAPCEPLAKNVSLSLSLSLSPHVCIHLFSLRWLLIDGSLLGPPELRSGSSLTANDLRGEAVRGDAGVLISAGPLMSPDVAFLTLTSLVGVFSAASSSLLPSCASAVGGELYEVLETGGSGSELTRELGWSVVELPP
jgi:hypothetical protein